MWLKKSIGRVGTGYSDALFLQGGDCRDDGPDLLVTEISVFTGMRIQSGGQDTGRHKTEAFFQVMVDDSDDFLQTVARDGIADIFQRQMGGCQCDTQHEPFVAGMAACHTGQHHDNPGCSGFFGKIFRMAGKGNACVVDRAFLYRSGYDSIELAVHGSGNGDIHE